MTGPVTRFLARERAVLEAYLPGLDAALAAHPLAELERPGGPAIAAFRAAGGPALVVPTAHKGLGASAADVIRVQRAIASRSPSLAVATTMHQFSVASLVEADSVTEGLEWMLLEAVATQGLLMASGFSEGRSGQSVLRPAIVATTVDGGDVVLEGSKKPCSLSASMDLLTASVMIPDEQGTPRLAVVIVPKESPGLSVRPFWGSPVLAGAENDEVLLAGVRVPAGLVARTESTPEGGLDVLQTAGFIWFELLMGASYLGVASALAERMLAARRGSAEDRARVLVDLEAAAAVLDSASDARPDQEGLGRALVARFAVQEAVDRVVPRCVEALGGMAFLGSGDISYLASAAAALKFHPPSRLGAAEPLVTYFEGGPLLVG